MSRAVRVPLPVSSAQAGLQDSLYETLRQTLVQRRVEPGARLPSSRAVAKQLAVSRTTVILVMERLRAEGYIVTRPGSGTYAATELPEAWMTTEPPRAATPAVSRGLSRRGLALAKTPMPAQRILGPARPFRMGSPALDLFPVGVWQRLLARNAKTLSASSLDYGLAVGQPRLRQAIAEQLCSRGIRCDGEQVVVVGGAQRGLDLICHLLLDPGDRVWLEEPGYPGALSACRSAAARVVYVPVDEQGLDIDWAARHAEPARLVCTTPTHQFPLGVTLSRERRETLLAWAERTGAWIAEDDYDCEFHYGQRPIPCLQALDRNGRVIYLGTFSKSLFPALRLGYLVVPQGLRVPIGKARVSADLHPPVLEQNVLADFILEGHYERHLRRMRRVYLERLEALQSAAEELCSGALRLDPVHTGLHAVASLLEVDARRVYAEALKRNVDVTPLAQYYSQGATRPKNGLLLGFGAVRPELVRQGMQDLARAIEAARCFRTDE